MEEIVECRGIDSYPGRSRYSIGEPQTREGVGEDLNPIHSDPYPRRKGIDDTSQIR